MGCRPRATSATTSAATASRMVTTPATTKNQLTGYSYDAAGNLLSDGLGHNFTYDAEDRISAVTGSSAATYTYGGDGKTTFALPKIASPVPGAQYIIATQGVFPQRP